MQPSLQEKFNRSTSFFFIGLGGIGMSALARLLVHEGREVSGSDIYLSHVTEGLRKEGIFVLEGQSSELVPHNTGMVVYSKAVSDYAPDILQSLQDRNIPTVSYPQLLGLISSQSKCMIAVSGTHGKTTTTAMLSDVLVDGGKKPTAIVGSIMSRYQSNYIAGNQDYFIAEACEYQDSFLNLNPIILVVTNIEADHLDYFGSEENVVKSFVRLAEKIPTNGYLVINPNFKNSEKVMRACRGSIVDYTKYIDNDLTLTTSGDYNRQNAAAASAVGVILGIDAQIIKKSLEKFSGTWRRAEYKGLTKTGAQIYDDYAHHPTEIRSFLSGMKEKFPDRKIIAIFEPHLFSRTKLLFDDFSKAFTDATEVIVTPIYYAREEKDDSISSEMLVSAIQKTGMSARYIENFSIVKDYILENTDTGAIICTIGAGLITSLSDMLVE